MAKSHETKVYAGGILNRINRIVMRTGGRSVAHYNDNRPDQGSYTPGQVIERTTHEPPTQRNLQDGVKENDV